MDKSIVYAIVFAGGVGVGILGTRSYFKRKFFKDFDGRLEKEVKEIRDIYEERLEKEVKAVNDKEKKADNDKEKSTGDKTRVDWLDNILDAYWPPVGESPDMPDISKNYTPERKEDVQMTSSQNEPDVYIIAPEEYEEEAEYDSQSLTLYSDGILVDEDNEEIYDPTDILGNNWKSYLEEATAAYFRNDDIQTDFEVVRDLRTFKEAASSDGN